MSLTIQQAIDSIYATVPGAPVTFVHTGSAFQAI
jgi:hypothetical protein